MPDQLPSPRCTRCQDCRWRPQCLATTLHDDVLHQLDAAILRGRPLQRGEHLYRAGERPAGIYAVRSGALKSYLLDRDGGEQVTGFHLPGELLGLDALGRPGHPGFAVALETSQLCRIPLAALEDLAGRWPALRQALLQAMSAEIHREQWLLRLTRSHAEARLAGFILELAGRLARRGQSAQRFILPMSRCEIASYLGLTSETVSRLLARYRQQGWLRIEGREVWLSTAGIPCQPLPD